MEIDSGAIICSNLVDTSLGEGPVELSDSVLRIGQIIDVLYVNDPRNISRRSVEYNVLVNENNQSVLIYKNCRTIDGFGNDINFKETVLNPTTAGKKGAPDLKEQFPYKNGAMVIVGFINDFKESGVILACIQHPYINTTKLTNNVTELVSYSPSIDESLRELPTLQPGSKSANQGSNQGQRILGEFNGVRWNINQEGEFTVIFQGVKDTSGNINDPSKQPTILKINKEGEFFIIDNLDQEIKISRKDEAITITDGKVDPNVITIDRKNDHITVKSAKTVQLIAPEVDIAANTSIVTGESVKLGGKDANQQIILGNDFMKLFNAFVTVFLSHKHSGVTSGLSITGALDPTSTKPDKMTNSQHLSQNVKVDKNFSGKPDPV